MANRKPIIAGNWKMNNTIKASKELVNALKETISGMNQEELPTVVVCPPFTALDATANTLSHGGNIHLGAQNMDWRENGAYTGEIAPDMLSELCVEYVIVGHSERRTMFGDTDERVNNKTKAILKNKMIPIVCCGETLEQREEGVTDSHIETQIKAALENLSNEDIEKLVFAYEPIWAIGTGKTCDSAEANRVIKMIRSVVASVSSKEIGDKVRILYGGSVKPSTIDEQMAQSDIDGALVGGASLQAEDFLAIIKGASAKAKAACC